MKEKTEQELEGNYNKFIEILKKYFTGERLEKLLFMYSPDELGLNLTVPPPVVTSWHLGGVFG
jgi:hypothetical protein